MFFASFWMSEAIVSFIRTFNLSQFTGRLQTAKVDSLKDLNVQLGRLCRFIGQFHLAESIRQTLDSHANWSMTLVRVLGLGHWVVDDVDHSVQVLRHFLGNK